MNRQAREVNLTLDEATRIFQDLEEFVISIDRIVSRIGSGDDPEILVNYVAVRRIPARLAWMRGLIGDKLEGIIGAAKLEELAEYTFKYSDDS